MDALVQAMIEDTAMQERTAYLRRGRVHADMSIEALSATWTAGYKAWFHHPNRPVEMQRVFADVGAEMEIRGAGLPYDTVRAEIDEGMEQAKADGPNDPGVRAAIRKFMDSLDEPLN